MVARVSALGGKEGEVALNYMGWKEHRVIYRLMGFGGILVGNRWPEKCRE